MPTFNFTKPFKNVNAVKTKRYKSESSLILKDIKGYIILDDNIIYQVKLENGLVFPIHTKCYKCKSHKVIYSQLLVGKFKQRLIIHRIPGYCIENRPYLPFAVGCVVIGDIVYNIVDDREYYVIKKCYIDNEDWEACRVTKAFRDRYDNELEKQIINKYSYG